MQSPDGHAAGQPRLSVIVPHYQDLASLDRCLDALEKQTLPRETFEIVAADNNSPVGLDAVKAVVAGRATVVSVTERGAGAARNGGVAASRGAILAFTDSDCKPAPDWLAEGLVSLRGHDFVGGRMEVLVDDPANVSPEEAFEQVFAFRNEHYVKRKGFTVSANLICERRVFEHVGGFLGAGMAEDTEWCLRARRLGYNIGYAPSSCVGHPARRNWTELMKKWRRANGDNFGLTLLRPGGRVRWFLRSLLLPVSAVVHTPEAIFSRDIKGWRAHIGAVITLHRLRWWRLFDSLRLLVSH
jgi:GT2 family glycosyltransferase